MDNKAIQRMLDTWSADHGHEVNNGVSIPKVNDPMSTMHGDVYGAFRGIVDDTQPVAPRIPNAQITLDSRSPQPGGYSPDLPITESERAVGYHPSYTPDYSPKDLLHSVNGPESKPLTDEQRVTLQPMVDRYNEFNGTNLTVDDFPDYYGPMGRSLELARGAYVGAADVLVENAARVKREYVDGGFDPFTDTWADRTIREQRRDQMSRLPSRQYALGDPTAKALYEGPQSSVTSLAATIPGIAVGAYNPFAGAAVSAALSGAAFYAMAKDQFIEEMYDAMSARGVRISQKQWKDIRDRIDGDAKLMGLFEAGPEALSQGLSVIVSSRVSQLIKNNPTAKRFATKMAEDIGARLGQSFGLLASDVAGEELTEYITYKGQENIRKWHGLRDTAPSLDEFMSDQAGAVGVGALFQHGMSVAGQTGWDMLQNQATNLRQKALNNPVDAHPGPQEYQERQQALRPINLTPDMFVPESAPSQAQSVDDPINGFDNQTPLPPGPPLPPNVEGPLPPDPINGLGGQTPPAAEQEVGEPAENAQKGNVEVVGQETPPPTKDRTLDAALHTEFGLAPEKHLKSVVNKLGKMGYVERFKKGDMDTPLEDPNGKAYATAREFGEFVKYYYELGKAGEIEAIKASDLKDHIATDNAHINGWYTGAFEAFNAGREAAGLTPSTSLGNPPPPAPPEYLEVKKNKTPYTEKGAKGIVTTRNMKGEYTVAEKYGEDAYGLRPANEQEMHEAIAQRGHAINAEAQEKVFKGLGLKITKKSHGFQLETEPMGVYSPASVRIKAEERENHGRQLIQRIQTKALEDHIFADALSITGGSHPVPKPKVLGGAGGKQKDPGGDAGLSSKERVALILERHNPQKSHLKKVVEGLTETHHTSLEKAPFDEEEASRRNKKSQTIELLRKELEMDPAKFSKDNFKKTNKESKEFIPTPPDIRAFVRGESIIIRAYDEDGEKLGSASMSLYDWPVEDFQKDEALATPFFDVSDFLPTAKFAAQDEANRKALRTALDAAVKQWEKRLDAQSQKNLAADLSEDSGETPGELGLNEDGKRVVVDEKGVRGVEEAPGIVVQQTVQFVPGKGVTKKTPEALYNEGKTEFLTADELATFKGEASEAPKGPKVMVNVVGKDGKTDAERGGAEEGQLDTENLPPETREQLGFRKIGNNVTGHIGQSISQANQQREQHEAFQRQAFDEIGFNPEDVKSLPDPTLVGTFDGDFDKQDFYGELAIDISKWKQADLMKSLDRGGATNKELNRAIKHLWGSAGGRGSSSQVDVYHKGTGTPVFAYGNAASAKDAYVLKGVKLTNAIREMLGILTEKQAEIRNDREWRKQKEQEDAQQAQDFVDSLGPETNRDYSTDALKELDRSELRRVALQHRIDLPKGKLEWHRMFSLINEAVNPPVVQSIMSDGAVSDLFKVGDKVAFSEASSGERAEGFVTRKEGGKLLIHAEPDGKGGNLEPANNVILLKSASEQQPEENQTPETDPRDDMDLVGKNALGHDVYETAQGQRVVDADGRLEYQTSYHGVEGVNVWHTPDQIVKDGLHAFEHFLVKDELRMLHEKYQDAKSEVEPEPEAGGDDHDGQRSESADRSELEADEQEDSQAARPGGDEEADGRPTVSDEVGSEGLDTDRSGRADSVDGRNPGENDAAGSSRPVVAGPTESERTVEDLEHAGEYPGNFTIPEDFPLGGGTPKQKVEANLEAIRLLRKLQEENRPASEKEQEVLARYVGWGGLKSVFDVKHEGSTNLYGRAQAELKETLSTQEYEAAFDSVRNAHYTARSIVDSMWSAFRMMGFNGGNALEPTVGTGNFLGLQPADMSAATKWFASELDTITGQIASYIYPEARIEAGTGFQDAPFTDGVFDIAIGNPPFGSNKITDKSKQRSHLSGMKVHNYIIAKTGMHLRPGGVMGMVVTHRFLDTADPEGRAALANDFKFLGAMRLPNDAFKENAGTEVTTDIVFLQKLRPDEKPDTSAAWLDTEGQLEDGIRVNRYFAEHPQNILGRSAMDGTLYGGRQEYTVHSDGRDLSEAMQSILVGPLAHMKGILQRTAADMEAMTVTLAQSDIPIGGMRLDDDGRVFRRLMDDPSGGAVVEEVTAKSLWKQSAREYKRLSDAAHALKKKVTFDTMQEFREASAVAYTKKGTKPAKPKKAEKAVHSIMDALDAQGAAFQWPDDQTLAEIHKGLTGKYLGKDNFRRLKGLLKLRGLTLRLIQEELNDGPNMERYRKELNTAYDAFFEKDGPVSLPKTLNLLGGDIGPESGLELSYLPAITKGTAKKQGTKSREAQAVKADILHQRVNFPRKEILKAQDSPDALRVSLQERGGVDLPFMARLTGKTVDDVIDDLSTGDNPQIFYNPVVEDFEDAETYLSGNVRKKLKEAREGSTRDMTANIAALKEAQPAPKTKEQITPNIRGFWMPRDIFQEFLEALGARNVRVSLLEGEGRMKVQTGQDNLSELGLRLQHPDTSLQKLFNAAAAGKSLTVRRSDGTSSHVDPIATKEVNILVNTMGKLFEEWAFSEETRTERIVDIYNKKMNTHIPRKFNGEKYFKPSGISPSIQLRRTQKNAAWRMVQDQNVLLDHVVGAGKTFTAIAGIMERRRIGFSKKPMIVVPNHLVVQWAKDFYKLYPAAKILAATPKDCEAKNRRRLFARIATGDFDAVIMAHSSFGYIEPPASDVEMIVTERRASLQAVLDEARRSGESKRTLTQIRNKLESYSEKLRELQNRPADEMGIDLKAMGVDYLVIDESQEFKNLEYATASERVVGMNDPKGSKKAFDLYTKARGVHRRGGGVVFATGTPVSNSLVEVFTVMSYLAHDDLVSRNQANFDAWSGSYASTETRLEYTATQKLKSRRVLAGLNNLSSLKQIYESFADTITMKELKRVYSQEVRERNEKHGTNEREEFPVPRVKGGGRILDTGKITPAQQEYMDYLVARMNTIEQNKSDPTYLQIDNALWVLSDARKMSLDIRNVDPFADRDRGGKVARAAKRITDTYERWDEQRGTQMVFCDLSTPSKYASTKAKPKLRAICEHFMSSKEATQYLNKMGDIPWAEKFDQVLAKVEFVMADPETPSQTVAKLETYFDKTPVESTRAIMDTTDNGFSVYDDLKAALVEKGIPENEIAFIHSYNTPDKKDALFKDMNAGRVRVLLGSSFKMGAGTNAQRRLVALHHIDAPWRPSDVEQREGRIIRQGNKFYEADPDGFEVEIVAYSTSQTSDTVMWQILERKAAAIEQFRSGEIDSVSEDNNDSNQYAEFMASSTGNPIFKQKLEAEREHDELVAETDGLLMARQNAVSFLAAYKQRIASLKKRIKAYEAVGLDILSYKGEKGTPEEYEAVIEAENDQYNKDWAVFKGEFEAYETEIEGWDGKGTKPKAPKRPPQPHILSKEVLKVSGYSRAIKKLLSDAALNKSVSMNIRGGKFTVEGLFGEEDGTAKYSVYFEAQDGSKFELESVRVKKAENSRVLAEAFAPHVVERLVETTLDNSKRAVESLKRQKSSQEKHAKLEVNTDKRDELQEHVRWYDTQVQFAEIVADIERSERPNRFIDQDARRPLSSGTATYRRDSETITVDGENYQTTGIQTMYGRSEATRVSDGLPAVLKVVTDEEHNPVGHEVTLQPEALREAPASTLKPPTAKAEVSAYDQVEEAKALAADMGEEIGELADVFDDLLDDNDGLKTALGGSVARRSKHHEKATHTRRIDVLRRAAESKYEKTYAKDVFRELLPEHFSATQKEATALGRQFGLGVVFFSTENVSLNNDGYLYNGTIYINVNCKNPHLFILGHELSHELRKTRPDLYQKIVEVINEELLNPEIPQRHWETLNKAALDRELPLFDEDTASEEFVSDIVGHVLTKTKFWNALFHKSKELFSRTALFITNYLSRDPKFKGFRTMSPRIFRDYKRVNDTIMDALATYRQDRVYSRLGELRASMGTELSAELSSGRTFVNTIFELQDEARYKAQRLSNTLQKEVQHLARSKRNRVVGPFAFDREYTDSQKARDLNEAMMIYRDLKINPGKADEFKVWAQTALLTARGADKLRIKRQMAALRRAENLTEEQQDFVDTRMDRMFGKLTRFANDHGVTNAALDHYVRRLWKREDLKHSAQGSTYGFKTTTTASKQRTRETIMDGWMAGDELVVKGITNSYQALAEDLTTVVANKKFIQLGMDKRIFSTKRKEGYEQLEAPGFSVWQVRAQYADRVDITRANGELVSHLLNQNTQTKNWGSRLFASPPNIQYAVFAQATDPRADKLFDDLREAKAYAALIEADRIEHRDTRNVFVKVPLYAPAHVAEHINRVTRKGSALWQSPFAKGLLRFNSGIKGWILMTSFFHHLAGARSWYAGINHGFTHNLMQGRIKDAASSLKQSLNPVQGYKEGLQSIQGNSPIIELGVRHGLTLGSMQDWDEGLMRETRGITETIVQSLGWEAGDKIVQKGKLFREKAANALFARFFAGLKARAFEIEYAHRLAKAIESGQNPDSDLIAEQTARLINADFGGLHTRRMGRNPDVQKALRLLLLAPDWSESNWRTITGSLGLNDKLSEVMAEAPAPPGMEKIYRGFWAGIILKMALATLLAQITINSWGDDDEHWWDLYAEQFAGWDFRKISRLRWLAVDVTPIYRAMVDIPEGERKVFSIAGHFADPLKIMQPFKLIKGKGSPLVRILANASTRSDWRDRPYTSLTELVESGQLVKKSRFQEKEPFFSALPSIALAQIRESQPIQFGYFMKWAQGEEDGISAILSSAGMHVANAYTGDAIRDEYDAFGSEIRRAKKRHKELKESGRKDAAGQYWRDNSALIRKYKVLNKTQERLKKLRARKRQIQASNLPADSKARIIENIDKNMMKTRSVFIRKYKKG